MKFLEHIEQIDLLLELRKNNKPQKDLWDCPSFLQGFAEEFYTLQEQDDFKTLGLKIGKAINLKANFRESEEM